MATGGDVLTNAFDVRSKCAAPTTTTVAAYNTALPSGSAVPARATLVDPGANTKMVEIVTSEPTWCYMNEFELYYKEAGAASFDEWIIYSASAPFSPYEFTTSSGLLKVRLDVAEIDQVVKVRGIRNGAEAIWGQTEIYTNEIVVKSYCGTLTTTTINSYTYSIPTSSPISSQDLVTVPATKTKIAEI